MPTRKKLDQPPVTTSLAPPEARKAIGFGQRGLQLATFEDAFRFAQALATSDFVPKAFAGKPADCLIAIQFGAELGLPPMAAIQNIAVINGKPTVYGDSLLAICQGSPAFDHGVFEEKTFDPGKGPDGAGWSCTVGRQGGQPITRTFTIADAKRAKLWGKDGPWTFYPSRMLQMRARAFALRDCFADLLRGIYATEELQGSEPYENDATDARSRVEAVAAQVREKAQLVAPSPSWDANGPVGSVVEAPAGTEGDPGHAHGNDRRVVLE